MYGILISLLSAAAVAVAVHLVAKLALGYAIFTGVIVAAIVFILIFRSITKKVTAGMEIVQRDMQANRPEKAIKTLENLQKYAPWQLYLKGQISAQIGAIYYLRRDFKSAFEYLSSAFSKHWAGMGMLAVCYMKKNKTSEMIKTFDKAVMVNKKEPVIWELYAFCLDKVGEHQKAIDTLEKGIKKVGGHEQMEANLELLKEGKKQKMKPYGDLWYQFHLEKPGAIIKQQTKAMTGRKKTIVRR
jgi:tetratricopeptide (TPR) repeat protein